MPDLTIMIPARNEQFLSNTVIDILKNIRGDTEVIAVLDGNWPLFPLEQHDRVTVLYYPESIGQRAATNRAARLSDAKYLMKVDAHCAFDEGFDVKLMEDMQEDWTIVPLMKNLHAFDWVCQSCNERTYQGPKPEKCGKCGSEDVKMDILWQPKPSPNSTSYRFNRELRFKYFGEYKERQQGDLVETMSLQGSCFMVTQEKYWELNLCDERWGSWGQQGTEVALKTWLSGGSVICSKKTWYAHMFRTQKGFSWPYPPPGKSQQRAIKRSQDIFLNDKWDKAVRPLSWLIEKFSPIPDWEDYGKEKKPKKCKDKEPKPSKPPKPPKPPKGVVYYTDNRLDDKLLTACQRQLTRGIKEKHIVSVSLKPIDFGGKRIVLELEPGYLTMFKQMLAGIEASDADVIFFCEHDVLYHPKHFDFVPPDRTKFYYNTNVWKVRLEDGHAIRTDDCRQTSGLIAWRSLLLEHYVNRVQIVEKTGFSRKMGFEPGTHNRKERVDDYKSEKWESEYPNLDIRHDRNLTPNRWSKDQFRNKKYTEGWREASELEGWGKLIEIVNSLI